MPAQPESYAIASGEVLAGGRFVAPDWAPAAGELKQISHAAGFFGTHGGATLAEIDPIYQPWHPLYGSGNSYSLPFGIPGSAAWASINAYAGVFFNPDTRDYGMYGAGHSAINVSAPPSFNLNDLRWKWMDIPLPFDGYTATAGENWPLVESATMPHYPNGEINFEWGEIQGSSSAWGALARPGIIQPIPGHSRAQHTCIPGKKFGNAKGVFLKSDGPTGKTGGVSGSRNSHLFDFDTARWSRSSNYSMVAGGSGGRGDAYDEERNIVVGYGKAGSFSNEFAVFNVATRTWGVRTSTNTKQTGVDYGGNVVHSASGLYIIPAPRGSAGTWASPGGGVRYDFFAVDLDALAGAGAFSIATLNVVAETTWPLLQNGYNDYLGWSYCPADKCLYCTAPSNGTAKYWKLTPPPNATTPGEYLAGTWTLSEHTFSSGVWVQSLGVLNQYNRNQWDKKSRSFIWHSGHLNDPVMSWRPHGV